MKKRTRRLWLIVGGMAVAAVALTLILNAFRSNLLYFFSPSEVVAGEAPASGSFRLGGMVVAGSVAKTPGSHEIRFTVTDYQHTIPVHYTGVLPDLFREGQGVVAEGKLSDSGFFEAQRVLAKHDEKYMPPEVAASLKKTPDASPAGPNPREATGNPR